MEITITATLTDEQINLLAKEKGYQEIVNPSIIDWWDLTSYQNLETPLEFIKKVYEAIIINDTTQVFLNASNRELEEQKRQQEYLIRQNVTNSITSSID